MKRRAVLEEGAGGCKGPTRRQGGQQERRPAEPRAHAEAAAPPQQVPNAGPREPHAARVRRAPSRLQRRSVQPVVRRRCKAPRQFRAASRPGPGRQLIWHDPAGPARISARRHLPPTPAPSLSPRTSPSLSASPSLVLNLPPRARCPPPPSPSSPSLGSLARPTSRSGPPIRPILPTPLPRPFSWSVSQPSRRVCIVAILNPRIPALPCATAASPGFLVTFVYEGRL